MKAIRLCGECADYDMKKHRCKRGAHDETNPRNPFYDDCPLPDVVEVVRCKDCKMYEENTEAITRFCRRELGYMYAVPNGFCSYGERKDNG